MAIFNKKFQGYKHRPPSKKSLKSKNRASNFLGFCDFLRVFGGNVLCIKKKREEDDERRVNRIFYICDGMACESCSWRFLPIFGETDVCRHTSHPEHAMYGKVDDPTYSDRFVKIDGNWWEVISARIHDGRED